MSLIDDSILNPQLLNSAATAGHNNAPMSKDDMLRDFQKDIRGLGRASGEGSAALPRLALRVIRAAADGLISTSKSPGSKTDDATLIYEAYTSEDSKKAEHTDGGAKANASKVRQLISLGEMVAVDPIDVAERAMRLRDEMVGAELKPKPLYAGLVDVARAQINSTTPLSDAEIRDVFTKSKPDKTIEKEWAKVQKIVEGLVTGEGSAGLKDQSPEAVQIQELVVQRLALFAVANQKQELYEKLVAAGRSEEDAINIAGL